MPTLNSINNEFPPVKFKKPLRAGDDVIINVDLRRFDSAWSKDTDFYVGENGSGGIGKRYSRFLDFLETGKDVEMPEVGVGDNGIPYFTNGRHRTAVFRDLGYSKMPMSVNKSSVEKFRELFT